MTIGHHQTRDDGQLYADTAFMCGLRLANPDWGLDHLGFGDFVLLIHCPDRRSPAAVSFSRMCGTGIVIAGASGRTHRVTGPPELLAELVSAMEAAGQSVAVTP